MDGAVDHIDSGDRLAQRALKRERLMIAAPRPLAGRNRCQKQTQGQKQTARQGSLKTEHVLELGHPPIRHVSRHHWSDVLAVGLSLTKKQVKKWLKNRTEDNFVSMKRAKIQCNRIIAQAKKKYILN